MEESSESKPIEKPIEQKKEVKVEKPKGPGFLSRFKNKLVQYKRVLEVSRKPDKSEFLSSLKITVGGIALLGIIGFVIFLIYFLVVK